MKAVQGHSGDGAGPPSPPAPPPPPPPPPPPLLMCERCVLPGDLLCGRCAGAHRDSGAFGPVDHMFQVYLTDVRRFGRKGFASGDGCNCLIDSVSRATNTQVDAPYIRKQLQQFFGRVGPRRVTASNYLTFDIHLPMIVACMGLPITDYKFVLIHLDTWQNGDIVGDGPTPLYIGNEGNNHFEPWYMPEALA